MKNLSVAKKMVLLVVVALFGILLSNGIAQYQTGKVYEAAAAELAVDAIVQIRGQVELRDETVSLRATEMQIPTLEAEDERPLVITLPPVALERQRMMQLGQVLANHPGYCEVHLAVLDE